MSTHWLLFYSNNQRFVAVWLNFIHRFYLDELIWIKVFILFWILCTIWSIILKTWNRLKWSHFRSHLKCCSFQTSFEMLYTNWKTTSNHSPKSTPYSSHGHRNKFRPLSNCFARGSNVSSCRIELGHCRVRLLKVLCIRFIVPCEHSANSRCALHFRAPASFEFQTSMTVHLEDCEGFIGSEVTNFICVCLFQGLLFGKLSRDDCEVVEMNASMLICVISFSI